MNSMAMSTNDDNAIVSDDTSTTPTQMTTTADAAGNEDVLLALLAASRDEGSMSDDDVYDDYGGDMSVNSASSNPVLRYLARAMDVDPPQQSIFFSDDNDGDNVTVADY